MIKEPIEQSSWSGSGINTSVSEGGDQRSSREGLKTIGRIAADYDVSLRTLRFYEERGLISPKREGVRRYYSTQDEVRLRIILVGKRLGFSLSEIEDLILAKFCEKADASFASASALAAHTLPVHLILEKIERLEQARIRIEHAIAELKAISGK